jgi:MFS family permease
MTGPDDPDHVALLADRTRWGLFWLLFAAGVAGGCQTGKVPVALPGMRGELNLSLVMAGWVLSINTVIGMLAGTLAGGVADWIGQRRLLLGGMAVMAAGSLLGALAPDGDLLLATRVLEGVGFVCLVVTGPALVTRIMRPEDHRLALGIWGAYLPAGVTLMLLASPVILDYVDWRGLWVVNGVLVGAVMLALAVGLRGIDEGRRAARRPARALWRDVRLVASTPGPVFLSLSFMVYTTNWFMVTGFLPTFLIETWGLRAAAAAAMTAFVVAGNVVGNVAAGWLLRWGVARWALMGGAAVFMGLAGAGVYSDFLPESVRLFLCFAFSTVGGLIPASIFAGAVMLSPRSSTLATTTGLVVQSANTGSTLGPPLLAALVTFFGSWQATPGLIVLLALAGAGLSLGVRRAERRRPRLP